MLNMIVPKRKKKKKTLNLFYQEYIKKYIYLTGNKSLKKQMSSAEDT